MAKRTKEDSTPDQVTPEGEPITNPEAQFPDVPPIQNEGAPKPLKPLKQLKPLPQPFPDQGFPPTIAQIAKGSGKASGLLAGPIPSSPRQPRRPSRKGAKT
jgi:hypothetical protein